mgnify:CR=1 FL=1
MRILCLILSLFALLSVCVSEKTRNHGRHERLVRERMSHSSAVEDFKLSDDGTVRDDFPCPEAAAIAPCICYEDTHGLSLDCTAAESNAQISEVFQQEFPVTEFNYFQIQGTTTLVNLNFSTNGVSFLSFYFCCDSLSIESTSEDVFRDSADRIVDIEIQNSQLTSSGFPFEMISEFPLLASLEIVSANLTEMPVIVSDNLFILMLEQTQIATLNPGK